MCVCVFSKYKTQYWGCSKNIKKLPGHCKYKQNIDFFDFMLQTHCKYKQKLTHPLQNHCKYKQKWNARSRTIVNTSRYERHVHISLQIQAQIEWLFKKHCFYDIESTSFRGLPACLACLAGLRLILYCKNTAFWKVAQFVLVFTMILWTCLSYLLVCAMVLEHAFHLCLYLQWFWSMHVSFGWYLQWFWSMES